MRLSHALLIALAAALSPALALADEAVSTSNGASAPVTVQTDNTPTEIGRGDAAGPVRDAGPDRRIHGEVGVAVGTGGYRSGYVALSGPIGDRGEAGVAFSQTKSDRRGYYGAGPVGPGVGPQPFVTSDCVEVEREDGLGDPDQTPACPPATHR
ncbi:MAG: hypothetical protein JWP35_2033 [Caulobacter sp.]|nr:hypothetical protein [Caulobacter sp.]